MNVKKILACVIAIIVCLGISFLPACLSAQVTPNLDSKISTIERYSDTKSPSQSLDDLLNQLEQEAELSAQDLKMLVAELQKLQIEVKELSSSLEQSNRQYLTLENDYAIIKDISNDLLNENKKLKNETKIWQVIGIAGGSIAIVSIIYAVLK